MDIHGFVDFLAPSVRPLGALDIGISAISRLEMLVNGVKDRVDDGVDRDN